MRNFLLLAFVLLFAVSCASKDMKPPYDYANIPAKELAPGLKVYIIQEGQGKVAKPFQTVVVNYHGMLENGNVFDSSFERGQPFEFAVGEGRVIKGWDVAFSQLPVGTKAVLELSPEMGYGELGTPGGPIPPNAKLFFHVELLEVM